jgi:hypothetical protein
MKLAILLLTLILPLKEKKNNLEIRIYNELIYQNDFVYLKFINNSDKKYFIPIDFIQKDVSLNNCINENNYYPSAVIETNFKKIKPDTGIDNEAYGLEYKNKYLDKTSRFTLIEPRSSRGLILEFNYYEKSIYKTSHYKRFNLKKSNKKYLFSYEFKIDKNQIEKDNCMLSIKAMDSLKAMGYECYHGTIYSNKVPMIIERNVGL